MTNKFNYFSNEIKFIQECPVCHTPRRVVKARILEEGETNRLVYLTCSHCQSSIIMLISLGIFGVDSIGLLTDLIPQEVLKFKDQSIVKTNDLIDLHNFLLDDRLMISLGN
jgi:transcription elongation factor Elf1